MTDVNIPRCGPKPFSEVHVALSTKHVTYGGTGIFGNRHFLADGYTYFMNLIIVAGPLAVFRRIDDAGCRIGAARMMRAARMLSFTGVG